MVPALHRFGASQSPVVTVDGIGGDPAAVVAIAAALAPFPATHGTHYPGLRRVITEADGAAMAYVQQLLETAAPFIGGGFDVDRFDLIEASFSLVTAAPATLAPAQRTPHFDATDRDYLAVMHYLADTPGTAFYHHRATGIERVDAANRDRYLAHVRAESLAMTGYTNDSNAAFERIGVVEGRADRLAVYQGQLLHSGIIPGDLDLSADPARGRLTANIFVQVRR